MTTTLDDIRTTGPLPVQCFECGNRLAFAAPHPFDDRLLLATCLVPKSHRTGGYADLTGYDTPGDPIGATFRYWPASPEGKRQENRRIVATGAGRYTFKCRCGNTPVLKDGTLNQKYSSAISRRHRAIAV